MFYRFAAPRRALSVQFPHEQALVGGAIQRGSLEKLHER